jgi:NAD(P)-dependent dehydrogenase (short-subunit alcohol dehydrogenase family)
MAGRLAGKAALVTGAGGAIGGAIARHFAAEGAAVTVADLNMEGAEACVADIAAKGGRAMACPLDVAEPAECERAVEFSREHFGGPHILVNVAAGPSPSAKVADKPIADWSREITINLTGYFLMAKFAIPAMAEAGGGSIINIASQLGHIGVPGRAAYCASKGGILQLTKVIAIDHAGDNIRCNSISPGAIDTPRSLWRYPSHEEAQKIRGRFYLRGTPGTVDEIATGAVFLGSDESSFMTGADLLIDGGYLAFKGTVEDLKS